MSPAEFSFEDMARYWPEQPRADPIHDGRLFARQDLALELDFTDREAIAQQMRESSEGNSADHFASLQRAPLGNDASLSQVGKQRIETAQLDVALKDCADGLSLPFVDCDLPVFAVVTERRHAADPQPFAF